LEVDDPDKASSIFIEREFPGIIEWEKNPHKGMMIPDSFMYGIAKKVN